MTTTEEIQELAAQKLENRVGVRKALKTLHELLHEGETVLNLGSGVYEGNRGLVVVTEQRVIFYDRSFGSSRQEDFYYSKISSVESVTGMLGNGKVIIFASGNQAVIHTVYPREYAGEVGDYVRSRLAAASPAVGRRGAGQLRPRPTRGAAPPLKSCSRGPHQRRCVRGGAPARSSTRATAQRVTLVVRRGPPRRTWEPRARGRIAPARGRPVQLGGS